MEYTKRLHDFLKASIWIVLGVAAISFLISCLGSSEILDGPWPDLLRSLYFIINHAVFWVIVGNISGDQRSAFSALILSFVLNQTLEALFLQTFLDKMQMHAIRYMELSYVLFPALLFALMHFKSIRSLRFFMFGFIILGIMIVNYNDGYFQFLDGFARRMGIDKLYKVNLSTSYGTTFELNFLSYFIRQLMLIPKILAFFIIYQSIVKRKNIWQLCKTCTDGSFMSRHVFSIVFWSLRIAMMVGVFGLIKYLTVSARSTFRVFSIVDAFSCLFMIFIVASVYRNFLVSHFVSKDKYPDKHYFLLNIPIANLFAWVFLLKDFNKEKSNAYLHARFLDQQEVFVAENRNSRWRLYLILIYLIYFIYQLTLIGKRMDMGTIAYLAPAVALLSLIVISIFLSSKKTYAPILCLFTFIAILILMTRKPWLIDANIGSGIMNIVLFYGMFHFDGLSWDNRQMDESE